MKKKDAKKSLAELAQKNVIDIIDVKKSFIVGNQQIEVLKGVNLSIEKGKLGIVFGPSGSGKSTMLHVLLGLEEPDSGSSEILGLDLYHTTLNEKRKVKI